MKKQLLAGGVFAAAAMMAWAAKDPIIMTVNGVDVPLSEFEYLYHKNSKQQLEAQPLDEYVEMFKLYKLKVADALNDKIDTLSSFRKEMKQYRSELAQPYMTDSAFLNKLIDESYEWSKNEVEANHIMLFKKSGENLARRVRLDSLRKELINAGADWTQLAANYSEDRGTANRGGSIGYITVGRFPYNFEKAVYTTPEGQISEVIETPGTLHLIKGGKRRPAQGKAVAAHILRMVPQGATAEQEAKVKQLVDSLYTIVTADPEQFNSIAMVYSEDKGSARQGGKLPPFAAGEMVPEFSDVAFALANGEISKPIRSQFGWHIIRKLESLPAASRDEIARLVSPHFQNPQDERHGMILEDQTAKLMKKHNAKLNDAILDEMIAYMGENGLDSTFYATYGSGPKSEIEVLTIGGKPIAVKEMVAGMYNRPIPNGEVAKAQFSGYKVWYINSLLRDAEMDWLEANEPDYRNLINEYRDGSLLYEASVRKVWDKAAKDTEGLEKFFAAHRGDYKWDKPHAKGFLVQTVNDSLATQIKQLMESTPTDSIIFKVRKTFGGDVQIDPVAAAKGDNAIVDYLMFEGPKAKARYDNFKVMFMYDGRIIDQPENVNDVRGQVTTDYQNELQELWNRELVKKYPVKINKKVLKQVK